MRSTDQFHLGIIVDDVDATLAELTDLFGYEWGTMVDVETEMLFPDGPRTIPHHRLAYSRSTPRIEIVQSIPDTIFQPVVGSGLHHAGYWSDDVEGDTERLGRAGYTLEVQGRGPDGTPFWTYNNKPGAIRIELVSRAMEPSMSKLWAS